VVIVAINIPWSPPKDRHIEDQRSKDSASFVLLFRRAATSVRVSFLQGDSSRFFHLHR
jgi:hypothetical protein